VMKLVLKHFPHYTLSGRRVANLPVNRHEEDAIPNVRELNVQRCHVRAGGE
jgi:hypothetical protein